MAAQSVPVSPENRQILEEIHRLQREACNLGAGLLMMKSGSAALLGQDDFRFPWEISNASNIEATSSRPNTKRPKTISAAQSGKQSYQRRLRSTAADEGVKDTQSSDGAGGGRHTEGDNSGEDVTMTDAMSAKANPSSLFTGFHRHHKTSSRKNIRQQPVEIDEDDDEEDEDEEDEDEDEDEGEDDEDEDEDEDEDNEDEDEDE